MGAGPSRLAPARPLPGAARAGLTRSNPTIASSWRWCAISRGRLPCHVGPEGAAPSRRPRCPVSASGKRVVAAALGAAPHTAFVSWAMAWGFAAVPDGREKADAPGVGCGVGTGYTSLPGMTTRWLSRRRVGYTLPAPDPTRAVRPATCCGYVCSHPSGTSVSTGDFPRVRVAPPVAGRRRRRDVRRFATWSGLSPPPCPSGVARWRGPTCTLAGPRSDEMRPVRSAPACERCRDVGTSWRAPVLAETRCRCARCLLSSALESRPRPLSDVSGCWSTNDAPVAPSTAVKDVS